MNTLTKKRIEGIAWRIYRSLDSQSLAPDIRIYFNNRCIDCNSGTWEGANLKVKATILENINPLDYFEWAAKKHIISMSFEGPFYDYMDRYCKFPDELENLFKDEGIFWELGNAWNLTFYSGEDREIEYTVYNEQLLETEETFPEYIWLGCQKEVPKELTHIMQVWYDLGHKTGDIGGCVIGQKMVFTYDNQKYEMCPITGWQGEGSWVPHVPIIKALLESIGATNVKWYCGRLD